MHEIGSVPSPFPKLTAEQQQQVLEAAQKGELQKDIAARLGLSTSIVCRTIARARQRAEEAAEIEGLKNPAVDPLTGITMETTDAELMRTMSRAVARDFYKTDDLLARASLAKTAASLVLARHKIMAPPPVPAPSYQPQPEPEQPKDEGLLHFN